MNKSLFLENIDESNEENDDEIPTLTETDQIENIDQPATINEQPVTSPVTPVPNREEPSEDLSTGETIQDSLNSSNTTEQINTTLGTFTKTTSTSTTSTTILSTSTEG